jgi:HAD superfamily hydrolase (TIGR01509 family)
MTGGSLDHAGRLDAPDVLSFRPQGVVFDLDGTLVDNMAWHTEAFDAFLARRGREPLSMAWRRRIDGKRNREIFPMLFDRPLTAEDIRAYEDEKEGMYRTLSRGGLRALPGASTLIDRLRDAGIRVAVATSAPALNVEHTLREIGLADRLDAIARGDQVPQGKPAPDVFLYAARLLGVPPSACLAFEDAPIGVAAAKAAGMRCIAITSSFAADVFGASEPPPDWTCADFDAYLTAARF